MSYLLLWIILRSLWFLSVGGGRAEDAGRPGDWQGFHSWDQSKQHFEVVVTLVSEMDRNCVVNDTRPQPILGPLVYSELNVTPDFLCLASWQKMTDLIVPQSTKGHHFMPAQTKQRRNSRVVVCEQM